MATNTTRMLDLITKRLAASRDKGINKIVFSLEEAEQLKTLLEENQKIFELQQLLRQDERTLVLEQLEAFQKICSITATFNAPRA